MHSRKVSLRTIINRLQSHDSFLNHPSPLPSRFSFSSAMTTKEDGADASRTSVPYTESPEPQSTVIIGAGIIGCATAYYLANSGNTKADTIHLVEASPELFASASGKAGGLLALWGMQPCIVRLIHS